MARHHRMLTAATVMAVLAVAGCTGTTTAKQSADTEAPVTLSFWHGWSQPHEVKAIQDNLAAFRKAHPNIKVVTTPNVTDDKILQGIRGGRGPDVVSSFTTDNVGEFCKGAFIDLNPLLKKAGVDKSVFVDSMVQYTQFEGVQCALPLLADAYGLYYNKAMFAAAGITSPPKTWSEFTADAVKLTKNKGSSYAQLGFMPTFHGYETTPAHYLGQWGPTYLKQDGSSNLAQDPAFAQMLTFQRSLVDALGGFGRLERYRSTFGDEYSPENAFEAGKVAMALDGEWRVANLKQDGVKFPYATAPLPVPDEQAANYGRGYTTGTVIGISRTSAHQAAAFELVKFLTTDDNALVSFANAINNVPSTKAALESPKLAQDPNFQTFVNIVKNPGTNTTPSSANGGAYQVILQDFAYQVEAGKVSDLEAALQGVDKKIDRANAQAKG